MNLQKGFLTIALVVLFLMPAWAQEKQRTSPELMARMQQLLSESEWKAQTLTGGPKGKWLLHEAKIRGLIDRLKAGQSVDPKEIDEIFREHSR